MNGFDKVGGLRSVLCFCERLGVCGEERKAERESRGGEDGESLSEDVGDNLGLEEMRVELVSIKSRRLAHRFIYPDATGFNAFANRAAFLSAMEYQHYPEGLFCREKKTKNLNPLHHKKVQDYFIREGKGVQEGGVALNRPSQG